MPRLLDAIETIEAGLGGAHDSVRESLQQLDEVIRRRLGVGARPYLLDTEPPNESSVTYGGEPLNPPQVDEARRFIDWLRSRDA